MPKIAGMDLVWEVMSLSACKRRNLDYQLGPGASLSADRGDVTASLNHISTHLSGWKHFVALQ